MDATHFNWAFFTYLTACIIKFCIIDTRNKIKKMNNTVVSHLIIFLDLFSWFWVLTILSLQRQLLPRIVGQAGSLVLGSPTQQATHGVVLEAVLNEEGVGVASYHMAARATRVFEGHQLRVVLPYGVQLLHLLQRLLPPTGVARHEVHQVGAALQAEISSIWFFLFDTKFTHNIIINRIKLNI